MNLDKNLIRHWATLFESEESKKNGTYIVCEELNDKIKNADGTAVDESSYDDSALTFEDVQEKINQSKESFKNLFGVIDVYAKGQGEDWAIFVELANRRIRFDSQYGEPIDDDLDGEYADACKESVETIKNEILGREAGNNFVSEFAFELDWDGERLVDKKYIDQASATVMKIVPKKNASQDNKRYFAERSAELYKMAQKMQVDAGADRMTLRKRSNYIWNKYAELELQYFLWGHDERDFDEFLETVGGYGKEELMAAIRGKHEGDIDESRCGDSIQEDKESNAGKEIIDTFTNILNYGLPKPELEKMLASLETLKGKEDMINQTELERLITMYKRKLGGDVSEDGVPGMI